MGLTKLELRDRKIQQLDQLLRVVEWDRPEVTFHAGALHFKWHDRLVLAINETGAGYTAWRDGDWRPGRTR